MAVSQAELKVILNAQDNMSGVLNSAKGSLGSFESAVAGAGRALVTFGAVAAAGLAAGLGGAVNSAANFEKTMSGVKAVSGATGDEMKSLSTLALKLGADTKFSATEAGKGIEELIKAGVSVADVMGGGAAAALSLAAAGEVDVGEAAIITSNAMNAFGLSGEKATDVANLIAGASVASATDVHAFGFALASVGSIANAFGLSFADVTTAISLMANSGIKGSDAGTSLKAMFLGLQPSTKKQSEAMKELGIITADGTNRFFDAEGKIRDYAQIAGVLDSALGGLTEQQRLQAVETIFGTDGMRAALVAYKAGSQGVTELGGKIKEVGDAQVIAKERLNNLSGAMEQLGGSVETAAIALGTGMLPGLRALADLTTAFVNEHMADFESFGASLGTAMTNGLAMAREAFETFVQALQGDWAPDPEQITPFTNAVGMIGNVIRDQVIPAIQDFISKVRAAFNALAGIVNQALSGDVNGAIQAFVALIGSSSVAIVEQLATWAAAFIEWIAPAIPGMLAALGELLTQLGAWLTGVAFPAIVAQLTVWGQAFVDWITPYIGPMLTMLGDLLVQLGAWITGVALPAIVAQLLVWGQAFVDWVAPYIGPMLTALGDLLAQFGDWFINTALPVIVAQLLVWGKAFIDWIGPMIAPFITEMGKLLAEFTAWFTDTALPAIVGKLKDWAGAFLEWVVPMIPGMIVEVAKIEAAITEELARMAVILLDRAATSLGDAIMNGAKAGITRGIGPVGTALTDALGSAFEAGQRAIEARSPSQRAFDELGMPIAEGTALGIEAGTPLISDAVVTMAEQGFAAISPTAAATVGQSYSESLITAMVDRFSNGSSAIGDAIRAVVETAVANNIDPVIALALAKAESNFNAGNRSGDNGHSFGLFQLHDQGQGAGMGDSRLDPRINSQRFLGGSGHPELFQQLSQQFGGRDLARQFGGQAEVSDPQFWERYAEAFDLVNAAAAAAAPSVDAAAASSGEMATAATTATGAETALKTAGNLKTAMARTQGGVLTTTAGSALGLASANQTATTAEQTHASAVEALIAGLDASADASAAQSTSMGTTTQSALDAVNADVLWNEQLRAAQDQITSGTVPALTAMGGSLAGNIEASIAAAGAQTAMGGSLSANMDAAIAASTVLAESLTPAIAGETLAIADNTLQTAANMSAEALRNEQAAITTTLLNSGVTPAQLAHTAALFDAALKSGNLTEAQRLLSLENKLAADLLTTATTPATVAQNDAVADQTVKALAARDADIEWNKQLRAAQELMAGGTTPATIDLNTAMSDQTKKALEAVAADVEWNKALREAEKNMGVAQQAATDLTGELETISEVEIQIDVSDALDSLEELQQAAEDAADAIDDVDGGGNKAGSKGGGKGKGGKGGKALGGRVSAFETYLVGERGPELFTPSRSGMIIPNNKAFATDESDSSATGGGTTTIVNNYNGVGLDEIAEHVSRKLTGMAMLGILPPMGFSGVPR